MAIGRPSVCNLWAPAGAGLKAVSWTDSGFGANELFQEDRRAGVAQNHPKSVFEVATNRPGNPCLPMKIIVHSQYSAQTISANLGKAEYSYYFVLAGYLPALARLGEIVTVDDPETEVDRIFDACAVAGEACVFLCFAPPHLVPITLRCPTIPVVAWEFSTIPTEIWGDDARCDWRVVFAHCGRVITLSQRAASLVREAMGERFPVFAIPTASYESFGDIGPARQVTEDAVLKLQGYLFDSAADDRFSRNPTWPPAPAGDFGPYVDQPGLPAPALVPAAAPVAQMRPTLRKRISITVWYARLWYHDALRDVLPAPLKNLGSSSGKLAYRVFRGGRKPAGPVAVAQSLPVLPEHEVTLGGVIYTSVFAPQDGRKNWQDLLSGFVQAFRDNAGATLFLKVPIRGGIEAYPAMHKIVGQFAPFKCRVVFFAGFLNDAQYRDLVQATTYYVNTSHCEGLCLPLMEFLSAGIPAIAPDHTAMADYINSEIAFVLGASQEHNVWPFDPRDVFTTMRYRLNWESLVAAYQQSYALAVERDPRFAAMGDAAQAAMREFCTLELVQAKLAAALGITAAAEMVRDSRMVGV